jgi:hypothetical protein
MEERKSNRQSRIKNKSVKSFNQWQSVIQTKGGSSFKRTNKSPAPVIPAKAGISRVLRDALGKKER